MTSLYFDAAYLGKLHWTELGSAEVAACAAGADELVVGLHGSAEFHSIGYRKFREGAVTAETILAVFAQFRADRRSGGLRLLPLTEAIVDRVTQVFESAPQYLYLRAADALHLATAAENGFKAIYSNDRHLLTAAPLFGLLGMNVIP